MQTREASGQGSPCELACAPTPSLEQFLVFGMYACGVRRCSLLASLLPYADGAAATAAAPPPPTSPTPHHTHTRQQTTKTQEKLVDRDFFNAFPDDLDEADMELPPP